MTNVEKFVLKQAKTIRQSFVVRYPNCDRALDFYLARRFRVIYKYASCLNSPDFGHVTYTYTLHRELTFLFYTVLKFHVLLHAII